MMMTRFRQLDFLAVVTAPSRHDKGCRRKRFDTGDKREFYFLVNNSIF